MILRLSLRLSTAVGIGLLACVVVLTTTSSTAFQDATPTPGFGPIVGPNQTLSAPSATPWPADLHPIACQLVVTAPEVFVYAQPDAQTQPVGSVHKYDRWVVTQIRTDGVSQEWALIDPGWILLRGDGVEQAQLDALRSCQLLRGDRPRTTVFGMHVINATSGDQILRLVERLAASGTPLGTIKGLNGTEQLLSQVKSISPQTVTVFRSLHTTDGLVDCPAFDSTDDMAALARSWLDSLAPYWEGVQADYFELMNECGSTLEKQTQFSIEAMRLANEQGRCLLLFSFAAGMPAANEFGVMVPAIQYAMQNPCQPGRTHGIAMHASSLEDDVLLSEASPWMALRFRPMREAWLRSLPEAADFPIFLTEVGVGGGGALNTPPCDMVVRDVIQYSYLLEHDPSVQGFHYWSFGPDTPWYDLTPCLDEIGDALLTYYSD